MDTLVPGEKTNGAVYTNGTAPSKNVKSKNGENCEVKRPVHPRLKANIFSQLSFW